MRNQQQATVDNEATLDGNRSMSVPGDLSRADSATLTPGIASPSRPDRGRALTVPTSVSLETLLFALIMIAAIVSRFWGLGDKALHHDESLHAYYSWVYFTGGGYRHDPLMHGPFLFHANALVYFLFGVSDATSRYAPAFFGVILVGLPYLLRGERHLGKAGALFASFFLLISPSITYQSRYIRHDIYTLVGTLALLICIVRYVEQPQRRWLVGGAAMVAFLLINHEIVFAILVIFGLFLYVAFLIERVVAWRTVYPHLGRNVLALHLGYLLALGAWFSLAPGRYMEEILDIPWENPTKSQQLDYWMNLLTNPLVIGMMLLTFAFIAGLFIVVRFTTLPAGELAGSQDTLLGNAPTGSVSAAVREAWSDKNGLALAFFAALAIYVPLYTSLFTNMDGLITSTVATDGTLLYWLGQHDVRRGEQPWFYFLLLLPQYEFLVLIPGLLMCALVGLRGVNALRGRALGERFFFRAFLVTWIVMIFAGLSYGGEKMPWLVVHIALPGVLIAAAFAGGVFERAMGWAGDREAQQHPVLRAGWPEVATTTALVILAAGFLGVAARFTYGEFVPSSTSGGWSRQVTNAVAGEWWKLAIAPALALFALVLHQWRRGAIRAGYVATFAMIGGLAVLQVHAGWNLLYYRSDVPVDMLVYTQTSPDIKRVMAEIDQFSAEKTGGKGLEVVYDSGMAWPMQWYLRDYQNKQFAGASLTGTGGDAPIILAVSGITEDGNLNPSDYTVQEYVLRWWFREELYRDFAIAPELPVGRSAWKSEEQVHGVGAIIGSALESVAGIFNIDVQDHLYRLVMYRDLEQPLGQYNFKMYVRNDLLPEFNDVRY